LIRIFDRDLVAAGTDKTDADGATDRACAHAMMAARSAWGVVMGLRSNFSGRLPRRGGLTKAACRSGMLPDYEIVGLVSPTYVTTECLQPRWR
jgi:hypothetical protein